MCVSLVCAYWYPDEGLFVFTRFTDVYAHVYMNSVYMYVDVYVCAYAYIVVCRGVHVLKPVDVAVICMHIFVCACIDTCMGCWGAGVC